MAVLWAGITHWRAWGFVRSRFVQIGSAAVVGVAGRAMSIRYLVVIQKALAVNPSKVYRRRRVRRSCGKRRAAKRLYLLWVDERETGRTMLLVRQDQGRPPTAGSADLPKRRVVPLPFQAIYR